MPAPETEETAVGADLEASLHPHYPCRHHCLRTLSTVACSLRSEPRYDREKSFHFASIAGQHLFPLPLYDRSRQDYLVQTLHQCMAAQAVSLTHCMAGSNTCVRHKQGQSSGGKKQKQTVGTVDSTLFAINSSLVCFGVVQNTARRINCPQVCFACRFIRTFWYWKDTELLHVYYAQKGDFPSHTCMYTG